MLRKILLIFLCSTCAGFTANVRSPEQISQELQRAQEQFEIAKKMFIPWYTGPLITGSASNVPYAMTNIQGYLYLTNNYATFSNSRKSIDTPNSYEINPLVLYQYGVTHWLDFTLIVQGFFRWQQSNDFQGFGDTTVQLGFQALKETPYAPNIRITLNQNFPSGKYRNLDPNLNGLDAAGAGAYSTGPGIIFSKVFWWFPIHPMSMRLALQYSIADHKVDVERFNAYGGGFNTKGKVDVGDVFNADYGLEWSITERWVFAMDIAYTYSRKSTFSGDPGTTANGEVASNGTPSSDQLSLAPAIEYNVSEYGGFIGGVWFSVTGRNSPNFVSLVLSYTQLF